jgi:predicted component of type VI protein secretion system
VQEAGKIKLSVELAWMLCLVVWPWQRTAFISFETQSDTAMLNAVLKILGGKQDGKLIPLVKKKFLIGREQDCHLRPSSDSVSRHHCVITIDEFGVRVRDLGSSNGTFLNNTRLVGTQPANPGDKLTVGTLEFELQFQRVGEEASDGSSNTTFSLNEFDLAQADEIASEETAVMTGDTAVINTADNSPTEVLQVPTAEGAPEPVPEPATEHPTETIASPAAQTEQQPAPQVDPAIAAQQAAQQTAGQPPVQPAMGVPYPGQPMPGQPPMPGYPPVQQPGYPPYTQQPFNPYMPQQPAYPPQPQYGMPYPQQPQQFPPQPVQGVPPQPAQPAPVPASAPVPENNEDEDEYEDGVDEPAVVLPPPEETGLKEEKKSDEGEKKESAPQVNPAADILKKMAERR